MKIKFKFKFFLVLATSMVFLFISETQAFSLRPAKMLITADKNTEETVQLKIINNEIKSSIFDFEVVDVWQDENGRAVFDFNKESVGAGDWVRSIEKSIRLNSGEEKIVNFLVEIPGNAYPGSHFVGLVVSKRQEASLSAQLVSILNIQVAGLVVESLSIKNWEPTKKINFNKNNNFFLNLESNSTVELPVSGVFKIKNIFGKEILKKDIELGNDLLPGAFRNMDVQILDKENKIFWPGLYKAETDINYGKTNQNKIEETSFWYLPVWSLAFLILIFLVIVFLIFRKKNKRNVYESR